MSRNGKSKIKVRLAEPEDFDSVVRFDHVAQADSARVSEIRCAIYTGTCWVLVKDAHPIGYGIIDYSLFFHQAFMSVVYLAPAERGQGLAALLISQIESICTHAKLFTSTNKSNLPMRKLLEKMGYKLVGEVQGLDDGDPEMFYLKFIRHKAKSSISHQRS
ncbi:MAG: GNAT family N-acetyltransferase [Candidatus Sulfotelmatobacter sp.]